MWGDHRGRRTGLPSTLTPFTTATCSYLCTARGRIGSRTCWRPGVRGSGSTAVRSSWFPRGWSERTLRGSCCLQLPRPTRDFRGNPNFCEWTLGGRPERSGVPRDPLSVRVPRVQVVVVGRDGHAEGSAGLDRRRGWLSHGGVP